MAISRTSSDVLPLAVMIIYNEYGRECQRLMYYEAIPLWIFEYKAGSLSGAYSMESDFLLLKYPLFATFGVIPRERSKIYNGKFAVKPCNNKTG